MPSDVQTSRGRARRIRDRNYFKAPTGISSRTRRLSLQLGAVGLLAAAGLAVWPSARASVVSPGRVSSAHAAWEHRCDACHVPWEPISRGRPGAGWLGRPPATAANRCDTCHGSVAHFAGQRPDANDCASCHGEHRGRDARLTRPSDAACLACHGPKGSTHSVVTDFATDHPPFRSPAQFTRQLKFSHAVHTAPGMALAGEKQARPRTLDSIRDEAARHRYAEAQRAAWFGEPIRLDCSACHQFQSGDAAGGPAPARSDGRYYAPVRYEAHCRACHPLSGFDDQWKDLTVPHGGTAADVRRFLTRAYYGEYVRERPGLLDFTLPAPRLDRPPPIDPEARHVLDDRVAAAGRAVLRSGKGCALCHLTDAREEIVPVVPKRVWLERAQFDHRAHRAAECRECHADALAGPKPGAVPNELEPPLVGDIDGCRRCHAPAADAGGAPRGGAGRSCTECHTYHGHGPQRGRGAPARDPDTRLDLDHFLKGTPNGR